MNLGTCAVFSGGNLLFIMRKKCVYVCPQTLSSVFSSVEYTFQMKN